MDRGVSPRFNPVRVNHWDGHLLACCGHMGALTGRSREVHMKIDDPDNFDGTAKPSGFDIFLNPADRIANLALKIALAAAILEDPDESLVWALHQAIILKDAEEDALYLLEIDQREAELAALYAETTADQTDGFASILESEMERRNPKPKK